MPSCVWEPALYFIQDLFQGTYSDLKDLEYRKQQANSMRCPDFYSVYVPVNLSNSTGLIHSGKIPVSIRNLRFA